MTLPTDYKPGMQIHLASAADPSLSSAPIAISSSAAGAPTLTRATLVPTTAGTKLGPNVSAILNVQGTNFVLGDTEVVGLGPTTKLTTATATAGSVGVALPADYKEGMQVHLVSAADPALTSGAVTISASAPTLKKAVLKPQVAGTKLAPGVLVTLTVQGTNLVQGDTEVVGLGPAVLLSAANSSSGSVALSLPPDYKDGMRIHLASKADSSLSSESIATNAHRTVSSEADKGCAEPEGAWDQAGAGSLCNPEGAGSESGCR